LSKMKKITRIKTEKCRVKKYIKNKLQDLFIQQWYSKIDNDGIYTIYRMVKTSFHRSPYIQVLWTIIVL